MSMMMLSLMHLAAFASQSDQEYWAKIEANVRTNALVRLESSQVTSIPSHPSYWTKVSLDNVELHLPINMINAVTNIGALHIKFSGQDGFMIHLSHVALISDIPFELVKAIETASLQDLDDAPVDERHNILTMLESQTLKPAGTYKKMFVITPELRAFVMRSRSERDGSLIETTFGDIYSPDGEITMSVFVFNEPYQHFTLEFIDSISFTGETIDRDRVVHDIEMIRRLVLDNQEKPNNASENIGANAPNSQR